MHKFIHYSIENMKNLMGLRVSVGERGYELSCDHHHQCTRDGLSLRTHLRLPSDHTPFQ